jgi:hypothetical protein
MCFKYFIFWSAFSSESITTRLRFANSGSRDSTAGSNESLFCFTQTSRSFVGITNLRTLSNGYNGGSVNIIVHFELVQRLRTRGVIPPYLKCDRIPWIDCHHIASFLYAQNSKTQKNKYEYNGTRHGDPSPEAYDIVRALTLCSCNVD